MSIPRRDTYASSRSSRPASPCSLPHSIRCSTNGNSVLLALYGEHLRRRVAPPEAEALLAQLVREARLADPRLAAHQHDAAASGADGVPVLEQLGKLAVTPDERRQPARRDRVEPGAGVRRAQHTERGHRAADALERQLADAVDREEALHEDAGAVADHHGSGPGGGLQAGREVRGLADDLVRLPARLVAGVGHHHLAGVHSDPDLDVVAAEACAEGRDGVHDRQSRGHRQPRVVLVRLGIAEVGEHPVAEVAGEEARVRGDRARARALVGDHDVAHVLGVELAGEPGRVDQVAEHDGQVPSLTRMRRLLGGRLAGGEPGAAAGAEGRAGRVRPAAGSAALAQGSATSAAEGGVLGARTSTVRAIHVKKTSTVAGS